jgi:hypothetical protein
MALSHVLQLMCCGEACFQHPSHFFFKIKFPFFFHDFYLLLVSCLASLVVIFISFLVWEILIIASHEIVVTVVFNSCFNSFSMLQL